MKTEGRFSRRHVYPRFTNPEDAPFELRYNLVVNLASESGMQPGALRKLVCETVNSVPDPKNYSDGYIKNEVRDLLRECEWFEVYDIIEQIHRSLQPLGVTKFGAKRRLPRDICGDERSTLGELLKKNPGRLPPPLDQSVEKAWGSSGATRQAPSVRLTL